MLKNLSMVPRCGLSRLEQITPDVDGQAMTRITQATQAEILAAVARLMVSKKVAASVALRGLPALLRMGKR